MNMSAIQKQHIAKLSWQKEDFGATFTIHALLISQRKQVFSGFLLTM
jgi:hypothetical protein